MGANEMSHIVLLGSAIQVALSGTPILQASLAFRKTYSKRRRLYQDMWPHATLRQSIRIGLLPLLVLGPDFRPELFQVR